MPDAAFTLDETYDELLALAIERPDDEVVFNGLRNTLMAAKEQGNIAFVMERAAQLGEMACQHAHLESLADEVRETFAGLQDGDHTLHGHEKSAQGGKAGKAKKEIGASKKNRSISTTWLQLLMEYHAKRTKKAVKQRAGRL